tara:strand:+ start:2280 stop:3347 length:1068 start_codon:yes stop_codon:yes gene_type:complete
MEVARCCKRYWYVPVATVLMATQPLLTTASLDEDGTYSYSMLSVTLVAEACKLLISLSLYYFVASQRKSHNALRCRDVVQFSVPAMVYFVNNNMIFLIMQRINSTQFQVVSCMKTVFTAVLFRLIMKRELTTAKWAAIVTLACGAASSELQHVQGRSDTRCSYGDSGSGEGVSLETSAAFVGVMGTLLSSLLSSFAGIYNEVLLKKDSQLHSIHVQNALLYTWGVLFNTIGLAALDSTLIIRCAFFSGFNMWTWVLLMNNALSGLAISAVLKYADNIVRVFAHTGAMVLTACVEVVALSEALSAQLPLAIAIVSASTVTYSTDGPVKAIRPQRTLLSRASVEVVSVESGGHETRV